MVEVEDTGELTKEVVDAFQVEHKEEVEEVDRNLAEGPIEEAEADFEGVDKMEDIPNGKEKQYGL